MKTVLGALLASFLFLAPSAHAANGSYTAKYVAGAGDAGFATCLGLGPDYPISGGACVQTFSIYTLLVRVHDVSNKVVAAHVEVTDLNQNVLSSTTFCSGTYVNIPVSSAYVNVYVEEALSPLDCGTSALPATEGTIQFIW